jgi:hypothetical protein
VLHDVDDIMGPNDEHVVCFGHDYDDYGFIGNPADARLIAQSPALLAALKLASEWMHYARHNEECRIGACDCGLWKAQEQADEAIAAAEGSDRP